MASLITNIYEITRRPCYVNGQKAIFHCWSQESHVVGPSLLVGGHSGGTVAGVMGLVEFEDGGVSKVYPEKIQFADGGGFNEIAWRPMKEDA